MTDDFVKQMQDVLRQQESQQQRATEKELHDAKVFAEEGPATWQRLKSWLKETADGINRGFQQQALVYGDESSGMYLTNKMSNSGIQVRFDPATAQISYQGSRGSGVFRASVALNSLQYAWENTVPCQNVSRSISFDDTVTVEKMGQIVFRCVVSMPQN